MLCNCPFAASTRQRNAFPHWIMTYVKPHGERGAAVSEGLAAVALTFKLVERAGQESLRRKPGLPVLMEYQLDARVQHLNKTPNKPSKYKLLEPTTRQDLKKHRPDYAKHFPKSKYLESLQENDCVKLCFINREDIWVWVERLDDDNNIVYGKLTAQTKRLEPLMQKNQRVYFSLDCVCEIREDEDSD
ncbi:hypothetical protein WJX74_000620 [Apatococcus lobatus]|uniref:Uncharacterized protein n=1 Tax=Apatococcus lobatus TaxID=904363 RepID=A0AAW1Q2M8_9CHLO